MYVTDQAVKVIIGMPENTRPVTQTVMSQKTLVLIFLCVSILEQGLNP
jgi:hypothetical protein